MLAGPAALLEREQAGPHAQEKTQPDEETPVDAPAGDGADTGAKPDEDADQGGEVRDEGPSADDNDHPIETEEDTSPAEGGTDATKSSRDLPVVYRDLAQLPFPARRMHELISEAAAAGNIEKLRAYIGTGDTQTMLSFGGRDHDPIAFLKSLSGDEDGYEILAILKEVLEAGFIKLEEGTENELYVWPYFYGMPLETLTPAQRVEMYRLLTHGDYEDMKMFGAYVFYRLGITPQGRWQFFVAGD